MEHVTPDLEPLPGAKGGPCGSWRMLPQTWSHSLGLRVDHGCHGAALE